MVSFFLPLVLLPLVQFSWLVGWLCWGLTSQSTIFQSYRDGAIASWVINQYFRGVKCLAQGHNTAAVGLEPRTSRSGVRVQFSNQRQEFLPMVHSCLWCCNSQAKIIVQKKKKKKKKKEQLRYRIFCRNILSF